MLGPLGIYRSLSVFWHGWPWRLVKRAVGPGVLPEVGLSCDSAAACLTSFRVAELLSRIAGAGGSWSGE